MSHLSCELRLLGWPMGLMMAVSLLGLASFSTALLLPLSQGYVTQAASSGLLPLSQLTFGQSQYRLSLLHLQQKLCGAPTVTACSNWSLSCHLTVGPTSASISASLCLCVAPLVSDITIITPTDSSIFVVLVSFSAGVAKQVASQAQPIQEPFSNFLV